MLGRWLWWAGAAALLWSIVGSPARVSAYAWMNRHGYANCASCHTDPSGGGLLTQYGRAQSELLLSSRYGVGAGESEEASGFSKALFGVVELPEALLLGADLRSGGLATVVDGNLVDDRIVHMRADLQAQLKLHRVRAFVSIGAAAPKAKALTQQAWLTSNDDGGNLVSREHWLGVDLADDAVLLRAGRIALPFGLRMIEHSAWVRSATRTDINQAQQHGLALSFNDEHVRAEVMAVAGNLQMSPDAIRERGAAGYLEWHAAEGVDVGGHLQLLRAASDERLRQALLRHGYGAFARLSPARWMSVLAEADVLVHAAEQADTHAGFVALVQADVEPWQGLHGIATLEAQRAPRSDADWDVGAWASVAWYFLSHFDVRMDATWRHQSGSLISLYLLQLHAYL